MNWHEDKTLLTLAGFTVFFTVITLGIVWLRPTDGQTYSVFTTLLTGFAGALTMHLKGDKAPDKVTMTGDNPLTIVAGDKEKKNV